MMTKSLLLASLIPAAVFGASNDWKDGQFEAGPMYGCASTAFDTGKGNNLYGGYVAAGYYFGNHLFQLEVAGLTSDRTHGGLSTSGFVPQGYLAYRTNWQDVQEYPVWFRYAYGVNFGPGDRIRLEAGPILGFKIFSLRTNYDADLTPPGGPTQYSGNRTERSGGVTFDYGVGAVLKCRITDHWSLKTGYRYVRSTSADFKTEVKELNTATAYAYLPYKYDEHGTHFISAGVEYRF